MSGLRDALEKAKGVESIRSIAYLIPDNEGEGFRELKAEALQRLEIAENGGANTGVVAEEEVTRIASLLSQKDLELKGLRFKSQN